MCNNQTNGTNLKVFDGQSSNIDDLLRQIEPYWRRWDHSKTLAIVETHMAGDAFNWFKRAKNIDFKSYEYFTKEIRDLFGDLEKDTAQTDIICEIANGFKPGRISELILKTFSLRDGLEIDLNIIIDTTGRFIPPHLIREMLECKNWKDPIKKSNQLDQDYNEKKWLFQKIAKITSEKVKSEPIHTLREREQSSKIKCYKCKEEGHIARNCSASNQQKYDSHVTESTEENAMTILVEKNLKPMMEVQVQNISMFALVDTAADISLISRKLTESLNAEIRECSTHFNFAVRSGSVFRNKYKSTSWKNGFYTRIHCCGGTRI